jgi:hypothetical protein
MIFTSDLSVQSNVPEGFAVTGLAPPLRDRLSRGGGDWICFTPPSRSCLSSCSRSSMVTERTSSLWWKQ